MAVINQMSFVPTLNEDCWMEVFGRLEFFDLVALSEVNQQFSTLAVSRMPFTKLDFGVLKNEFYPQVEIEVVEDMFERFGEYLTNLTLDAADFDHYDGGFELIHLVRKHCANLKQLKLKNFNFGSLEMARLLLPVMKNVSKLTMDYCYIQLDDLASLLEHAGNLQKLKLKIAVDSCEQKERRMEECLSRMASPKLETIILSDYESASMKFPRKLFEMNPQVKRLELRKSCDGEMKEMCYLLPNLEVLRVDRGAPLQCLADLTKLKELEISFNTANYDHFVRVFSHLAEQNSITKLGITHEIGISVTPGDCSKDYKKLFDAVRKFKGLQSLKLFSVQIQQKGLLSLIKGLPRLKDFHLFSCYGMVTSELIAVIESSTSIKNIHLYDLSEYDVDLKQLVEKVDQVRSQSGESINLFLEFSGRGKLNFNALNEMGHLVKLENLVNKSSAFF